MRRRPRYPTTVRGGRSIPLLAVFTMLLAACGSGMEKVDHFDPRPNPPDNIVRNAHVRRSENGKLQLLMDAPVIEQYSGDSARTVYPEGVYARFFNGPDEPTAILRARHAVQYDRLNITLVRDSVVIIDLRSNDTTYLQDLIWDAGQHRIYSEHPLRSVNGQRVTIGDAFESDDNMQSPQIIHQRGTVEWKEE